MSQTVKKIIKGICFALVLGILFCSVQETVKKPDHDIDSYKYMTGFYDIPNDTLDAVYIGSSIAYLFSCPSWAWNQYGVAMYPFASGGQPISAARYLIEEARKKQPDALYIINVPAYLSVGPTTDAVTNHLMCDYIPLSSEKFNLIQNAVYGEGGGISILDKLEYFFPLIRYHTRWSQLLKEDFRKLEDDLKGNVYPPFLEVRNDYSDACVESSRREPLTDAQEKCFRELFDYCTSNQVKCLFVISPIVVKDKLILARLNTFCDICQAEGFPVVNMMNDWRAVGIDWEYDYLNETHVNIHGAIKTTDYLLKYLIAHYPFTDKRGSKTYGEWDRAYELYSEFISPYVLDIEWNREPRDMALSAPELSGIAADTDAITITWKAVPGVDGYAVYRRAGSSAWEQRGIVNADKLSYDDREYREQTQYNYTIVGFKDVDGMHVWGNFDFTGLPVVP